ncbi:MAG: NAD(P)/FAD-dependent oxidoreductase [Pseudomonadota bacterium]
MDRRTFASISTASLLCAPSVLRASKVQRVAVIGAGAAGLTAAYHLEKTGITTQVLEAGPAWGGRVKRLSGFADVPLDLGAEWIHGAPTLLGRIVGVGETDLGVQTIDYAPQTFQFWHKGRLKSFNALRHAYEEVKFRDTTWYGFFEKHVLPAIGEKIAFNAAVSEISSEGAGVSIRLTDGRTVEADKAIVTVPLSVLQRGQITFADDLSPRDLRELRHIDFGSGFKVFLKFDERFYPDILLEGSRMSILADTWASKIYYDAALGKPTGQNLFGLFTVSDGPLPRAEMDDRSLMEDILTELTDIFGDVVRRTFVGGVVQNWSQEPHIRGSYSMTNNSDLAIDDILIPVAGRVFFAGEALGDEAQSTVHGAAFSAIKAVDQLWAS